MPAHTKAFIIVTQYVYHDNERDIRSRMYPTNEAHGAARRRVGGTERVCGGPPPVAPPSESA